MFLFVNWQLKLPTLRRKIVYKARMGKVIDMLQYRSRNDSLSDVGEFEKLCAVLGAMQIPVEDFLEIEDEDSGRYRILHQQMLAASD